jgi:hypothetical protein
MTKSCGLSFRKQERGRGSGVPDKRFVNTSEKVKREKKSKFALKLIEICTRLQEIKAHW